MAVLLLLLQSYLISLIEILHVAVDGRVCYLHHGSNQTQSGFNEVIAWQDSKEKIIMLLRNLLIILYLVIL